MIHTAFPHFREIRTTATGYKDRHCMKMDSASAGTATSDESKQPCFLNAITSAVPAAVIGWVFGFIPSIARNRSFSSRDLWLSDGNASAINLAKFSGVYSFAHCLLTRIRQVDDAWNRGAAGDDDVPIKPCKPCLEEMPSSMRARRQEIPSLPSLRLCDWPCNWMVGRPASCTAVLHRHRTHQLHRGLWRRV